MAMPRSLDGVRGAATPAAPRTLWLASRSSAALRSRRGVYWMLPSPTGALAPRGVLLTACDPGTQQWGCNMAASQLQKTVLKATQYRHHLWPQAPQLAPMLADYMPSAVHTSDHPRRCWSWSRVAFTPQGARAPPTAEEAGRNPVHFRNRARHVRTHGRVAAVALCLMEIRGLSLLWSMLLCGPWPSPSKLYWGRATGWRGEAHLGLGVAAALPRRPPRRESRAAVSRPAGGAPGPLNDPRRVVRACREKGGLG